MILQILIGTLLMLISIVIAGFSYWAMEIALNRARRWLTREPHRPKLMLALCVAAVWILAQITAGVWTWALAFWFLEVFATLEASVYFSLVAFTTLGFGDILLPNDWRLLSGMAAANGLLNFGLLTAILVETLRQIRLGQIDALRRLSD
ncbi:MAG: ion channel [Paracoccaceae bacterium]